VDLLHEQVVIPAVPEVVAVGHRPRPSFGRERRTG
jgi:hypothetical protein